MEIYCLVCNKRIIKIKSKKNPPIFCSNECRRSEKGKKIVAERTKKTLLEKYGENYFKEMGKKPRKLSKEEINQKRKETNLKKYGVENCWQSEEVKQKIKKTVLERYNVENIQQLESTHLKTKKTNLERYNDENYNNSEQRRRTNREKNWSSFLIKLQLKELEPKFTMQEFLETNRTFEFKCLNCNQTIIYNDLKYGMEINRINCNCTKVFNKSQYENEIYDFLSQYNLTIERNKRFYYDGNHFYECDIYISEFNLGIEFHGIYWHSELYKEKDYHQNKWSFFKEKEVRLIQIFQNEWIEKKEIIKGLMLNLINMNKPIWARKCELREIGIASFRSFLEANHLQGHSSSLVKLGLYYNNELVQVMSFGKSRFNKQYEWENIRTCTKVGYHIIGGFSKLLTHFIKNWNPQSIISYIDLRYFNGEGYIKNHFKMHDISEPNFFYFKKGTILLESRNKYQKHKLMKILDTFDNSKTEHENMIMNDFLRIYDAGNKVLVWKNHK